MRKVNKVVFMMVTIFCGTACEKDDSALRQQMIDQQVQNRLETYFAAEKKRCRVKILEEASHLADSTLRSNPVFIALDSLQRPPVPNKPPRPEFERRTDSIKIEPIIPKLEPERDQ